MFHCLSSVFHCLGCPYIVWWLPFAPSQCRALTVRGPMGYLRKPNKFGVIFNSASDLPAIGPHLLLHFSSKNSNWL